MGVPNQVIQPIRKVQFRAAIAQQGANDHGPFGTAWAANAPGGWNFHDDPLVKGSLAKIIKGDIGQRRIGADLPTVVELPV